jgi:hypothetical protein
MAFGSPAIHYTATTGVVELVFAVTYDLDDVSGKSRSWLVCDWT